MGAQTVLFDLGHVVVDWQPIRLYRQIFDTEAEAQRFCDEICTLDWHMEHDRGVPMPENAARLIAQYPHYEAPIKAWQARWLDMFPGYMPGVPPLIAALEERRVPLYGLSNLPADIAQETFDAYPIIKLLRDVVVSGEEKVIKPDPRIYEITLARMGHPDPATVLFIDNSLANVEAAEALGIRGHHFTGADGLKKRLETEGLL
ncbi:MAG: HAD family phosphatase [Henriciella sp.]|nr:HAD family phosphatase [Henriciella sp.]